MERDPAAEARYLECSWCGDVSRDHSRFLEHHNRLYCSQGCLEEDMPTANTKSNEIYDTEFKKICELEEELCTQLQYVKKRLLELKDNSEQVQLFCYHTGRKELLEHLLDNIQDWIAENQ